MEETKGIDFKAMPRTAFKVITSPAAFFREMPKTGGFGEPLVFMMVMGVTAGVVNAILTIVGIHTGVGIGKALAWIIVYPLAIVIPGFIWTAIVFVVWKLLGSGEPYATAYRCMAYGTALWPIIMALKVVPLVGMPVVFAVGACFYAIASIEAHKIPSRRAWLVFGIIGLMLISLFIGGRIAQRGEAMKYRQQLEQSTQEMQKN